MTEIKLTSINSPLFSIHLFLPFFVLSPPNLWGIFCLFHCRSSSLCFFHGPVQTPNSHNNRDDNGSDFCLSFSFSPSPWPLWCASPLRQTRPLSGWSGRCWWARTTGSWGDNSGRPPPHLESLQHMKPVYLLLAYCSSLSIYLYITLR